MKTTFFALACLACLASSAIAFPTDNSTQNGNAKAQMGAVTSALDAIGKRGVDLAELTRPGNGLSQSPPSADGEIKLTGNYQTTAQSSGIGATSFVTLTTFHISLKVVGGKIVGVAATEEVRDGSGDSMTAALSNAESSTPTTKSWVFGPADFVASHKVNDSNTAGKNPPSSIPSDTKTKLVNNPSSTKQEQSVSCNTVSPSSPGCAN